MAPWDMRYAVEKIASTGNTNILLTDRGTSFGYNNLVSDMRAIPIMQKLGYPVLFDATHSVQLPAGEGDSSGVKESLFPRLLGQASPPDAKESMQNRIQIQLRLKAMRSVSSPFQTFRLLSEEWLIGFMRVQSLCFKSNNHHHWRPYSARHWNSYIPDPRGRLRAL